MNQHNSKHVLERIESMERAILERLNQIMMSQDELAAAMDAVDTKIESAVTQLNKAQAEIVGQIAALKAAVGGNTTPTVDAAFTKLSASVDKLTPVSQALDDVTPDVPPATP